MKKFDDVVDQMKEVHRRKNEDYGDSFHNIFKEEGMPYAVGHIKEKVSRFLNTLKNGNKVIGESALDSLLDLASYSIMLYCELAEDKVDSDPVSASALRPELRNGDRYYYPDYSCYNGFFVNSKLWKNSFYDHNMLDKGLVYVDKGWCEDKCADLNKKIGHEKNWQD